MADPSVIALFLIIFVGFWITNYLLQRKKQKNSLRRIETTYGTLKVFSGVFMGLGFAYLLEGELTSTQFQEVPFIAFLGSLAGIITVLIFGLILYFISHSILGENIFRPVREFGTASSIFGKRTSYLNLPETGAYEMIRFAHNFNSNTLNLANQISLVNVHINELSNLLPNLTTTMKRINPSIEGIEGIVYQFENMREELASSKLQHENFTALSEELKDKLSSSIFEMISEMSESYEVLNLLTINIAIESANSENQAFQKISEQMRDYYKNYENITDQMSRRFVTIEKNFEDAINKYKESLATREYDLEVITSGIKDSKNQIQEVEKLSGEIEVVQNNIADYIRKIKRDFPTDY